MNKIIGLVTAWGAERWIRPSIEQALGYCDDVMVSIAPFYRGIEKYEDRTREIADRYGDRINLIDLPWWKNVRSYYLNELLEGSGLYEAGNWVWLLDSDEFYTHEAYERIRKLVEDGSCNYIRVEEKFFYVNMRRCLRGSRDRLFRIDSKQKNFFSPIDNWSGKAFRIATLPRETGLFHYSLLANNRIHRFRWKHFERNQTKVKWYDLIYRNYNLKDEKYWINRNFELFGIRSPWPDGNLEADEDGTLFEWPGRHPEPVEKEGLPEVKDFRGFYDG